MCLMSVMLGRSNLYSNRTERVGCRCGVAIGICVVYVDSSGVAFKKKVLLRLLRFVPLIVLRKYNVQVVVAHD